MRLRRRIYNQATKGLAPLAVTFFRVHAYNWDKEADLSAKGVGILSTLERIQEQREEVLTIARRYGATKVRIIGSVARGEDDEESDIDFLVDLAPGRSLFDLGGMLMDLNLLFGKHVDITTEKGLKRRIRDRVLSEAVSL